jgi:diacylglycerol kinase (ATP)
LALPNQKSGFIKGRIRGGLIAFKGAFLFVTTEHSAMVQFALAVLITLAGFYYKLSPLEWALHALVVSLVLAVEALNTAIEKLCDFVHDEHHTRIGFIKDISAGGVWFAAMGALVVELIIFLPKIFS